MSSHGCHLICVFSFSSPWILSMNQDSLATPDTLNPIWKDWFDFCLYHIVLIHLQV